MKKSRKMLRHFNWAYNNQSLFTYPLGLIIGVVLFSWTSLDYVVTDHFYDWENGYWPWKEAVLTEKILHVGGKWTILLLGLTCLGIWLGTFRLRPIPPFRKKALYLFLSIGLCSGVVGLWKSQSVIYCPWSLVRYGGGEINLPITVVSPPKRPLGHCFPAAHAASGFAMMALFFIFRKRNKKLAITGLVTGIMIGNLFGFAQVARGAHFLSHQLWSGITAWYVCLYLYWIFFRSEF